MNCVFCLKQLIPEINWTYLLSKEPICHICEECKEKLEIISGEVCAICGRSIESLNEKTCSDCYRWEQQKPWKGVLEKNIALFHYNPFLKNIIAQFKYRGDYHIAAAFSLFIPKNVDKNKIAVPIPLSAERLYERGFNQAEAILHYANIPYIPCLSRTHGEKQSKKTRQQRLQSENIFSLKGKDRINAQDILLIDDIYTTGATLRHAAKLLKEAGAHSVSSFTIAR